MAGGGTEHGTAILNHQPTGRAMHCLRRPDPIRRPECPALILSTDRAEDLGVCRRCPQGRALMATVRVGATAVHGNPQEENMPLQQEYSQKQIGEMCGVSQSAVSAARLLLMAGKPLTGPAHIKVAAKARELGLDWAQSAMAAQSAVAAQSEPSEPAIPEQDEIVTNVRHEYPEFTEAGATPAGAAIMDEALDEATESILEAAAEEARAEMEREDTISGCQPDWLLRAAPSSRLPEYGRDFPSLGHIPLEALVGEITRRMPRAEVVLR